MSINLRKVDKFLAFTLASNIRYYFNEIFLTLTMSKVLLLIFALQNNSRDSLNHETT